MFELPPPLWLPPRPAIIRPADQGLIRAAQTPFKQASFLPGMFPAGMIAAQRLPASASYIGALQDTSDQTTYTFTGVSIGAADATRRVVVVFSWSTTNAARNINSATINGIGVVGHVLAQTGPGGAAVADFGVQIFSALVPTGTTATIVVALNGAVQRAEIGVYRQVNEINASPHATMTDTTISSNTTMSGTLNIPAVGMLYAGSICNITPAGGSINWLGISEQYDHALEGAGIVASGGFETGLALQTPRTVVSTNTNTSSRGALAAMSWG